MYQKSFLSGYGFYLTLFSSIVLAAMTLHYSTQIGFFFNQQWNAFRSLAFEGMANFLSGTCYIGGVAFGIKSALKLKEHHDTEGKTPLSISITLALVSALLLSLPAFIATARNSTVAISMDAQSQTEHLVYLSDN